MFDMTIKLRSHTLSDGSKVWDAILSNDDGGPINLPLDSASGAAAREVINTIAAVITKNTCATIRVA